MRKIGNRVLAFNNRPAIISSAGVVGPKEAEGPLKRDFDVTFDNSDMGEDSWEKAERVLQKKAAELALHKAGLKSSDIDVIFAGDLLNQCTASSFGLMGLNRPYVGMYGACSTMALTLINAGLYVDFGVAEKTMAVTSSHFCTAERQYRFPLEYGGVRPLTSQWTVTGAGAVIVGKESSVYLNNFTIGKIVDAGIKDANNMGAAMAPDDVKIRPYPKLEGMVFFYTQIQYLRGFRALFKVFESTKIRKKQWTEINTLCIE